MISDRLPTVLTFKPPQNSISVYRALKNARECLEQGEFPPNVEEGALQAALDDLELMMLKVG